MNRIYSSFLNTSKQIAQFTTKKVFYHFTQIKDTLIYK